MIHFSMQPLRCSIYACALLGATLLAEAPAFARRPIEDAVFNSPRPHQNAGGEKVRVHYVSRRSRYQDRLGFSLQNLQQSVQRCVASQTRGGKTSNPPTSWPDEAMVESRTDSYYARNRGITYTHGIGFGVNPTDCSLLEVEQWTAVLESAYGMCRIDLLQKTYEGQCDPKGHEQAAVAVPPPPPPPARQAADLARMKANPQTAAMAAAMEGVLANAPKPTGVVKTIDGVKCDVMSADRPLKATYCVMRNVGSFVPSARAIESNTPNILLELDMPDVGIFAADRVKLDMEVGASVFTPYLRGFTKRDDGNE